MESWAIYVVEDSTHAPGGAARPGRAGITGRFCTSECEAIRAVLEGAADALRMRGVRDPEAFLEKMQILRASARGRYVPAEEDPKRAYRSLVAGGRILRDAMLCPRFLSVVPAVGSAGPAPEDDRRCTCGVDVEALVAALDLSWTDAT